MYAFCVFFALSVMLLPPVAIRDYWHFDDGKECAKFASHTKALEFAMLSDTREANGFLNS